MRIHRADQHPSSRGAAFPLTPLRARLWGSAGAGGVRVDELVADGGVGGALVAQVGHAPLLEGGGGLTSTTTRATARSTGWPAAARRPSRLAQRIVARVGGGDHGVGRGGIDCPLGWPRRLVEFVAQHELGAFVAPARVRREGLAAPSWALRQTDLIIRSGKTALPTSATGRRSRRTPAAGPPQTGSAGRSRGGRRRRTWSAR
jgi:hypothetical protein